jgi:hypothetical protein
MGDRGIIKKSTKHGFFFEIILKELYSIKFNEIDKISEE